MRLLSESSMEQLLIHRGFAGPHNIENFEDALSDDWIIEDANFGRTTATAYNGSYSGGIAKDNASLNIATWEPYHAPMAIDSFEFYWRETGDSRGGGIQLWNETRELCGFATDNPEWIVYSSAGNQQVNGGVSYGHWVYVKFDFDWGSGQFDYYVEDMNGLTTVSGTKNLRYTDGVKKVRIMNYHNGWTSDDMHMWFDDLELS